MRTENDIAKIYISNDGTIDGMYVTIHYRDQKKVLFKVDQGHETELLPVVFDAIKQQMK